MATSLFPVIRQCRIYLCSLFEFGVVENFVYSARITVILTSDLFGCMSLWLRLCRRWRPITISGIVHNLENVQIPLFTLLPRRRTIFSLWHSKISHMVTWTLESNQSKPEVDITIHSVASESPRGLLQCHEIAVSFHCFLCVFGNKPYCGIFYPLALHGIRVNVQIHFKPLWRLIGIRTVAEHLCCRREINKMN